MDLDLQDKIICGDCIDVLKTYPDNCIDLIVTSPPYADNRKNTYGGVPTKEYVKWFIPRSEEFFRVLKPTGTFILNIKEKVESGERSTYVLELILELKKQGWIWTEEFIWHKKIRFRVNGPIDFEMPGKDACNLIKVKHLQCIRTQ